MIAAVLGTLVLFAPAAPREEAQASRSPFAREWKPGDATSLDAQTLPESLADGGRRHPQRGENTPNGKRLLKQIGFGTPFSLLLREAWREEGPNPLLVRVAPTAMEDASLEIGGAGNDPDKADHKTFDGRCMAMVGTNGAKGRITLRASSTGLEKASIALDASGGVASQ